MHEEKACIFQNILADLGFPQVETEIWTDNSTASNAANKSIRIRRLQSTAMRYHWIQDRIAAGHFFCKIVSNYLKFHHIGTPNMGLCPMACLIVYVYPAFTSQYIKVLYSGKESRRLMKGGMTVIVLLLSG